MSAFVWLNIPASAALANLGFGLPKCLLIGYGTAFTFQKLCHPTNEKS